MQLETERLIIKDFTVDMARDVHLNSLDKETEKYVPDEVFKTEEDAKETIEFLMSVYDNLEEPQVHPVFLKKDNSNIGYVQLVPLEKGGYEIGYHIAEKQRRKGYATEATKAFLRHVALHFDVKEVYGICLSENRASLNVLSKCGFVAKEKGYSKYQNKMKEVIKSLWTYDESSPERSNYVKCEWF